jgi:sodium transport system permease protein
MNTVFTVMKKELVDLFRDRRTLLISLAMGPLLMPVLILGIGVLARNRFDTQRQKPLELAVVGAERAPNLIAWLASQNIIIKPPPEDADGAIRDQSLDVVLKVGEDFEAQWRGSAPATVEIIHDSSREDAEIPVERVEKLLQGYAQGVGALRLLARGVSPSAAQPLRVAHRDLITPSSKVGQSLAFLPYLLILLTFIGGSWLVIDATAGERERQSLEPLLATPAGRGAIMSGKILAACLYNVLVLSVTLAMFKLSFELGPNPGVKLDVSLWVIARILFGLLPMILVGTCLLTFIAAGVKSVKEAQSYLSVLTLMPMIPTLMLMVNPVKNQLWMMATPFLAQNQLILKLVRSENVSALEWAVYLGAGFGLGLVLWFLAARRYHDEQLAISA